MRMPVLLPTTCAAAATGSAISPAARAWHRPDAVGRPTIGCRVEGADRPSSPPERPARILAAFDRNHYDRFRRQFLATLRAWGHREAVTAVTYGLYPGERARLESTGVEVVPCRDPGIGPVDAAGPRLPPRPRALARGHARRVLGCRRRPVPGPAGSALGPGPRPPREGPRGPRAGGHRRQPGDRAVDSDHPRPRRAPSSLRDLLRPPRSSTAGFAAGTAGALLDAFRAPKPAPRHLPGRRRALGRPGRAELLHPRRIPGVWQEVPDGWNYCLACRDPRTYRFRGDGRVESLLGRPVHVVHGNGRTLGRAALAHVG